MSDDGFPEIRHTDADRADRSEAGDDRTFHIGSFVEKRFRENAKNGCYLSKMMNLRQTKFTMAEVTAKLRVAICWACGGGVERNRGGGLAAARLAGWPARGELSASELNAQLQIEFEQVAHKGGINK